MSLLLLSSRFYLITRARPNQDRQTPVARPNVVRRAQGPEHAAQEDQARLSIPYCCLLRRYLSIVSHSFTLAKAPEGAAILTNLAIFSLQAFSLPGSMYLSILAGAVWGVPIALPLCCLVGTLSICLWNFVLITASVRCQRRDTLLSPFSMLRTRTDVGAQAQSSHRRCGDEDRWTRS